MALNHRVLASVEECSGYDFARIVIDPIFGIANFYHFLSQRIFIYICGMEFRVNLYTT